MANSEVIKHGVIWETANVSLPFILLTFHRILKQISQKIREKKITLSRQTKPAHFHAKRATAEVEFLPFAGKTNVMLNLSKMFYFKCAGM